jgi:phosphatidylglycerol---prolipoprotein diacylglyceryl transferase
MSFPIYFHLGPLRLHPHFVMEAIAYTLGLYISLFRRLKREPSELAPLEPRIERQTASPDNITSSQRTSVSVGALVGALIGAKLLVLVQHFDVLGQDWRLFLLLVLQGKTIVGALLGGLIGVELTKKWIGVRRSTGDSFVFSVLWGTAIGRVGCFLTGLSDRTYGTATSLPWGVDFGDGIARHPTQLYEVGFLVLLFLGLWWCKSTVSHPNHRNSRHNSLREGDLFKIYMIGYFGFRFLIDFIKPEFRPILGLSAIQLACIGALLYYAKDSVRLGQVLRRRLGRIAFK